MATCLEEMEVVSAIEDNAVIYAGYTQAQLAAAFETVRNPIHWKDPIDAIVTVDQIGVTYAAIVFFTATEPKFVAINDATPMAEPFKMRVTADGYRRGPAGDH